MEKCFIKKWDENKGGLKEYLKTLEKVDVDEYLKIVKIVVEKIINENEEAYGGYHFDTKKITQIDNGEYQGTLLFFIPKDIYQPDEYDYIFTSVDYGSCSGCDTLLDILFSNYLEDGQKLSDSQVNDIMTLCLHLIQKIKWLEKEEF
jgi:hypothetical protein